MTDNVKVIVRCRPLSEKEIADGHKSIVEFEGNNKVIVEGINDQPGSKTGDRRSFLREYQFDQVFDWSSSQEDVYDKACRPIVESVLEGYNGTIFAYGQTGTGKTYTMEGNGGKRKSSLSTSSTTSNRRDSRQSIANSAKISERSMSFDYKDDATSIGVIPRTFKHIFQHISKHPEIQFLVRVSYLEIYQENIHDLLRKDASIKLELHERPDIGVFVKDLTSFFCKSVTEIERVMKVGNQNRRVAATDMNEHSSRSHAIFMITIEQQLKLVQDVDEHNNDIPDSDKDRNSTQGNDNKNIISNSLQRKDSSQSRIIKVGKLNLIDLAGSESQKKTNSFGQRQKESVKINLSLSALGNVINSLMKANTQLERQQSIKSANNNVTSNANNNNNNKLANHHTPYRDSKLTRLLQDSLGGNAKTLMIANIGPANYNYDETINTLNYASRAKLIRNKPRLNEDPKDALLRELQKEIDDLRQKLADLDANPSANNNNNQINHVNKQVQQRNSQKQPILATRRKSSNDNTSKLNHSSNNIDTNYGNSNSIGNNIGNSNSNGDNNETNQTDKSTARSKSNSTNDVDENDQEMIAQELVNLKQKLASLESKLLNGDDTKTTPPISIKSNKQTIISANNELNSKEGINYLHEADNCNSNSNNVNTNRVQATSLLENYMMKQEAELEAKRLELANQTSRESAIRNELEKKEEVELLTKESFSSAQHELDAKKRLIRQILVKVKQMRDAIEQNEQTYRLELDELDQLQYELNKELKLKCLIMDNFIPNCHVNQLLPRISYDEQTSNCLIKKIDLPDDRCITWNDDNDCNDCVVSYEQFWQKITNQFGNSSSNKVTRSLDKQSSSKLSATTTTTFNNHNGNRPKSEFEKLEETLFPGNIRFKCDQFIDCQFDPKQTLKLIHDKPNLFDTNQEDQLSKHQLNKQTNKSPLLTVQELLNKLLDTQESDIVI